MKEKTNITVQDQAGNSSKTMLPAVPSRLVEVGQMITSKSFETGDYGICCDNCTDSKGQNIGNMYRCDKCGRLVS